MQPRMWIALAGALASQVLATGTAHAQDSHPSRAVRLIVPSSPGGGTDTTARMLAPKLTALLGQQVVVENRAGAAAVLGTESVARSAPDGYTLLMGQSTMTIVPSTYKKVRFDPIKDFAPVSMAVVVPQLLVGHPSLPPRTTHELIAFAKSRPGQLDYAAGGYGGNPHMSMALFVFMAGVEINYVPYKSGNAGLIDVLAGRVPLMMSNALVSLPHVRNARLRAYGITSARRAGALPEIPTLAEGGVTGYEAVQWFAVLAPAGTPGEIVGRLHRAVSQAVQDEEFRARVAADGGEATFSKTPEELHALMRSELAKWAKTAKAARIEPQ